MNVRMWEHPRHAGQRRRACASAASPSSARPRARSPRASGAWAAWPSRPRSSPRSRRCSRRATGPLAGRRVLVTAGGTREPLDGVRFLGNRSSGRMGAALADEAARAAPRSSTLLANAQRASGVWSCSRGRDDRRARARGARARGLGRRRADGGRGRRLPAGAGRRPGKRERGGAWSLELEPTADVLAALGGAPPARARCSSASRPRPAPTSSGREAKLVRKGVDLIVLNDVSRADIGFDVDDNEVVLVAADGASTWRGRRKRAIAARRPRPRRAAALVPGAASRRPVVG